MARMFKRNLIDVSIEVTYVKGTGSPEKAAKFMKKKYGLEWAYWGMKTIPAHESKGYKVQMLDVYTFSPRESLDE